MEAIDVQTTLTVLVAFARWELGGAVAARDGAHEDHRAADAESAALLVERSASVGGDTTDMSFKSPS